MNEQPTPLSPPWFAAHHERLHHWRHDNLHEVLADLAVMQTEIEQLLAASAHLPATVTITATQNGQTMGTYAPGQSINLAAELKNAEDADVAGTVSWTASAGTVSPTGDLTAQLVNAPLGDVTVTATASNGVTGTDTLTIADQTIATVTITDSAA